MARQIDIDMVKARQMRADAKSWDDIGKALGVTGETVHRKLDPSYGAKRKDAPKPPPDRRPRRVKNDPRDDDALATIVPDTRTWQQKMFGDPPASRSALAMRKQTA